MTLFEFVTQDVDTLAAFLYGLVDETEQQVVNKIYCATGIEVSSVSLAPELRIESWKQTLSREKEESDGYTEHS